MEHVLDRKSRKPVGEMIRELREVNAVHTIKDFEFAYRDAADGLCEMVIPEGSLVVSIGCLYDSRQLRVVTDECAITFSIDHKVTIQ